MNARKATLLVPVLLVLLVFTVPAATQQSDDIIVSGADEIKTTSVSIAQGLIDQLAGVGPRIVLQYANELRHIGLVAVPGSLQTLLNQVSARVVVYYANTISRESLATIPSALQTLLGQVPDRVVIQYANQNRVVTLAYPVALLGDATPPEISNVQATRVSTDTMMVCWTTDEYADREVVYGTASGVYTGSVSDALYAKQHELTLPSLPVETTIYFRVRSTDQSGNTAQSTEHTHTPEEKVYLPLVLRD